MSKQVAGCIDLTSIYTLKDLFHYFYDRPNALWERPRDIAVMYYWSFLAYHKPYLRNGLFASRPALHLYAPSGRTTPFAFVCKLDGATVVSVRGAHKAQDVTGTLLFVKKKMVIPSNLQGRLQVEYCKRLHETMHQGIFNHALKVLSMILDELDDDDDDRHPPRLAEKPVYVYGHSLGAACSIVIAHLLNVMGRDAHSYCLACPGVFKALSPILTEDRLGARYKHFYTDEDPVVDDRWMRLVPGSFRLYRKGAHGANVGLPVFHAKDKVTARNAHLIFKHRSAFFGEKEIVLADADYSNAFICPNGERSNVREHVVGGSVHRRVRSQKK